MPVFDFNNTPEARQQVRIKVDSDLILKIVCDLKGIGGKPSGNCLRCK